MVNKKVGIHHVFFEELENAGNVIIVAKGHIPKDEFLEEYVKAFSIPEDETPTVDQVEHIYMRKTPRRGYLAWWTESAQGKGAFPVTRLEN